MIVYDEKTVARVNNLGSKLPAFDKTKLRRNVFSLKPIKGDHLVIFTDGTISSLKGLIKVIASLLRRNIYNLKSLEIYQGLQNFS